MQRTSPAENEMIQAAAAYLEAFHDVANDRNHLRSWIYEAANQVGRRVEWFNFNSYFSWDEEAYDEALSFSGEAFQHVNVAVNNQDRLALKSFALVHLMIKYAAYRDMDQDAEKLAQQGVSIYARLRAFEERSPKDLHPSAPTSLGHIVTHSLTR